MGSGDWFKTIIGRKKPKKDRAKKAKGSTSGRSNAPKLRNRSNIKVSYALFNSASNGNGDGFGLTREDIAARQIQTAFRGFMARRALRRLKGFKRLQVLSEGHSIQKQTATTSSHIRSWSKIQAEIRARRAGMVTEGRIKQKKQESQLKLEAKLHDLEVDWCGGAETMEETVSKIHQREEAAVKRERALAYAFAHQWRASSGHGPLSYEVAKGNWGWSWVERWVAARPWEARVSAEPTSPVKVQTKTGSKTEKKTSTQPLRVSAPVKIAGANGKGSAKRILPKAQETSPKSVSIKMKMKKEERLPLQATEIAI